jgi:hypothetical protein
MFTGTIASNIAYGNEGATREEIEAAARQANCEFVWGMPKGFDTESESVFRAPPYCIHSIFGLQSEGFRSVVANGSDWPLHVPC